MGTKKEINVDIDDPRAGKIAEVLRNKTCKKILGVLAEEELTESEIAERLNMPLNTVGYNVKKLREAGLIEPVKGFLWSVKGKRVYRYRPANKKIVISPKVNIAKIVAGFAGIFVLIALVAMIAMQNQQSDISGVGESDYSVKHFNSIDEIKEFLRENAKDYGGYGFYEGRGGLLSDMAETTADSSFSGAGESKSRGAESYSETNIQVEGVDEPDIVKNDGKYIYVVSGDRVVIVDAYPAEDMEILSEINVTGNANVMNMFVNKDRLIVLANGYESVKDVYCALPAEEVAKGDCAVSYNEARTFVYIYDISDKKEPSLERNISIDGSYRDARMINDYVYLVSSRYVRLNGFGLPLYKVDGVEISPKEIFYIDMPNSRYMFTSISSIGIENGNFNTEVYLTGYTGGIYVSKDNVYLTFTKNIRMDEYYKRYVDEVLIPLLSPSEDEKIRDVMDSDRDYYEKQKEVGEILDSYMDSLDAEEKVLFMKELEKETEDFQIKISKEVEKTVVYKIRIDKDEIDFKGQGEVPGRVLNQFSMDEYKGNFRIATTTFGRGFARAGDSGSFNHLYVLDDDLRIIGKVENLAPGERIYSVRFMGERAYMVTFRQVDPLYVIDLSDAGNPEVLGYLKVTGYSDYLHPYDENTIIGIGKESDESGRVRGVKISLFDVSDVENPSEIGKYEIKEGKWSKSEALYDHKAFLFDREKGILVVPVSYYGEIEMAEQGRTRYRYWQGAYVFDISLEGIQLRGKVDHCDNLTENKYFGDYVRRSLYMGNVLYTVSNSKVKANDLDDLREIGEVDLGCEEEYYVKYGASVGLGE